MIFLWNDLEKIFTLRQNILFYLYPWKSVNETSIMCFLRVVAVNIPHSSCNIFRIGFFRIFDVTCYIVNDIQWQVIPSGKE